MFWTGSWAQENINCYFRVLIELVPFFQVGYEVLMCDFHVPHMHLQDRVVWMTSFCDLKFGDFCF
jgi:hypothetical protein